MYDIIICGAMLVITAGAIIFAIVMFAFVTWLSGTDGEGS